jgi:hypothetical protein
LGTFFQGEMAEAFVLGENLKSANLAATPFRGNRKIRLPNFPISKKLRSKT